MSNTVNALEESRDQVKTWGYINPFVFKKVLPFIQGIVLDAGCATGDYAYALSNQGFQVFASDLLSWPDWQQTVPGRAVQADLLKFPFPNKHFDTVISFNVLEHIPNIEQALTEIQRVCQGRLIFSVPNCEYFPEMGKAGLIFHHWLDRSHVHFWEIETLREMLVKHGFRVVLLERFGTVRPETLLFHSLGFPLIFARGVSRIMQAIPWRKKYSPLLLAVVEIGE